MSFSKWCAAAITAAAGVLGIGGAAGEAVAQCSNGYRMIVTSGESIVPGTVDTGLHADDATVNVPLPFPVTLYGVAYISANVSSNGNIQFGSNSSYLGSACLPVAGLGPTIFAFQSDLYEADAGSGQGIFTSVSGAAPTRVFNIEWRARFCCVSGAPTENFEVRLYESSSRVDIVYGATSTQGSFQTAGLQASATGPTNQYACATSGTMAAGTMVTFIDCPLDPGFGCSDYTVRTRTGGTIVPGVTDVGNHCDDCTTEVLLPFMYSIYDGQYDRVRVSSNGNIQFASADAYLGGTCLPVPYMSRVIFPYWADLRTDAAGSGIFSTITGVAPNRVFYLEWRVTYFGRPGTANFEVALYENQRRFDVTIGTTSDSGDRQVVGVQAGSAGPSLSVECLTAGSLAAGQSYEFICPGCEKYAERASSGAVINPGASDIGNHCDDCTTSVAFPFPVRVHDAWYTSANVSSNGNIQFASNSGTFGNSCLPYAFMDTIVAPYWDDLRTDGANEGIFTSVFGAAPNRGFVVEWRGHHFDGAGLVNFEAIFYEGQSRIDFIYNLLPEGGSSATIGIQRDTGSLASQHSCNSGGLTSGTMISYYCAECLGYTAIASSGAIDPGVTDIGNHCDDCVTSVTLPFPVRIYDEIFTTAYASSNGNVQFLSANTEFGNSCSPAPIVYTAIMGHWDDLLTDFGTGAGIYSSVTGTAPNRVFNLEWRASYFYQAGMTNFEIRMFENQDRFEVVYGTSANQGASATAAIQRDTGTFYTLASCNSGTLTAGKKIVFLCCHADFNMDGVVNVQDIFDFLGAWFSGDLRADFNRVNGINVQDVFDFLSAWFAGCS